ncbi:AMP-binding protein, partial [Candidatus Sumerlaeota bacterium]|nr:AMP-binding protein [Candidatus Sumerlaeota bacterium]
ALKNGELVCIFAEGQITRTGLMLPFRRGFKHILTKAPAPVIPIYLDGVWGSIFSFERKKFIWKWPRQIPYHVRIAVGEALPHDVSMHEMRQSVLQLSADCALVKKSRMRPVHHRFIRNARKHWGHFCVADSRTPPLKCGRTLLGSIILARRLRKHWGDQTRVGIFLPPSVGAVLTNIAAAISGRTAVNLNYTTGPDVLAHCIETAGLKTVVTAHEFLEKLKMEPPPGAIYIDDIGKQKRRLSEVIGAIFAARLLPIRALESYCGAREHPSNDSLITIIFSSGSTGMPKGVMLSHFNIASNLESFEQAISLWPDDRLIGFLPFFHSFGYTVSLWGGLCIRYGVIHHTNPMEAKVIGDLVEQYGVTVMVGTPTFLQHYIRKVEPRKFGSLEFVLTGAEKLHERTANAFQERFGIYVYEGYGTTECSPIVSINVDDYRSRGFHQVGNKRGSVGHPVPGVVVRITDIETAELLPGGERGMIQVRGPNIMQGYLGMEEKTAEVLKDGWYDTGDVGYIDEEGFIHITDRLARFSKIGGEMIPHLRIEEELHQAIGATEQVFVVTAIPDLSKGERLAVLYTVEEEQIRGIAGKLGEAGLPNLWIPRADMFFRVEQIPILGTGKLDLSEIRRIALRSAEPETASTP